MDVDWILSDPSYVYVTLFLALLGGAFGLPIPEDLPLLLAGVAIQQELVAWGPAFFVCYTAIICGDIVIYGVGRYFGAGLFRAGWFRSRVPHSKVRALRRGLERRSFVTIVIARHLFYLRTITFLTCGAVRMRFATFVISDMLAALVSASLMISVGYLGASKYSDFTERLGEVRWVGLVVGIVILVIAFVTYRWSARQAEKLIDGSENSTEEQIRS